MKKRIILYELNCYVLHNLIILNYLKQKTRKLGKFPSFLVMKLMFFSPAKKNNAGGNDKVLNGSGLSAS